ncbi:hypothetical protein HII31_00527 [Pseudocercospora fuligena]|uniref:Uncharacterized protein n=1 Tax=Pseudocercospora fuligena TaxID=685502 RepID=A0A8H6RXU2_9PEZI|nr:hypothetical protein HII31_00527 [Pseudocercospora fuligena]
MADANPRASSNATVAMPSPPTEVIEALLYDDLDASTQCHFKKLSGELRNRIYREVLVEPHGVHVFPGYRDPGLLSTCYEIRSEAQSIFYYENLFFFDAQAFNSDLQFKFLHHLRGLRFPNEKRSVQIGGSSYVDFEPSWPNLLLWLKRVHAGDVACGLSDPSVVAQLGPRYQNLKEHVISGMFATARRLRKKVSWGVLESIFLAQRPSLIVTDERWAQD